MMKTENELTFLIRKSIFEVYNNLGLGLLESVYEKALMIELQLQGLNVKCQIPVSVYYKNIDLDLGFRADIIVEEKVIVEIKSVEELSPFHHKQLLNYLKLTILHLGILVNFNTHQINHNIVRMINGYL
ncbi:MULTISPECIES: GxxExxY protein [unclassified Chryseobacterium]|uniref:GxxExxY protein n=1 Tax=unclassified Chryseobacterium TaxID=2593645 RepID=UPI000AD273DA|nr:MULTISPECIES: GxxExxY protein [unclassified Chryseobacterium]